MAHLLRLIFAALLGLVSAVVHAEEVCGFEVSGSPSGVVSRGNSRESACSGQSGATWRTKDGGSWQTVVVDEATVEGTGICRLWVTHTYDNSGATLKSTSTASIHQACWEEKTADKWCEDAAAVYNSWNWANTREGVVDSKVEQPLDAPFEVCMPNADLPFSGMSGDGPPGCIHFFTPTMRGKLDQEGYRYWGDSWMAGTWNDGAKACVPGLDNVPGDPPVPPAKPQGPCKGFEGSVNGVDVCIDPSAGQTEGVDWTQVTDAEGNIKEQKTEIKCEGEKCTVKTTLGAPGTSGGTTTTTTTTRGAYCANNPSSSVCKNEKDPSGSQRGPSASGGGGGGSGGGGGGGNEGDGFCKENPDSPICKNGTFGGSCAANFTCDGDAIQCAIAKEQHLRNCRLFDDPSDESRLYDAEKAKDPNRKVTSGLPGNENVDMTGRIDMSDAIGGGGCISDLSISVLGQSISLPISVICPYLAMLGNVLVAVSLLLAVRIVGRG